MPRDASRMLSGCWATASGCSSITTATGPPGSACSTCSAAVVASMLAGSAALSGAVVSGAAALVVWSVVSVVVIGESLRYWCGR